MFAPSIQELSDRTDAVLAKKWGVDVVPLPMQYGYIKAGIARKPNEDGLSVTALFKYVYVEPEAIQASIELSSYQELLQFATVARVPAYLIAIREADTHVANLTSGGRTGKVIFNGVEPVMVWKFAEFVLL